MNLKFFIALIALTVFSGQLAAEVTVDCGEQPVKPSIVDGATSTMEQLVANSKAVNAFIAEADEFLDCEERRYKKLSASKVHKDRLAAEIKAVTANRNDAGDEFNAQVAAYKAANP